MMGDMRVVTFNIQHGKSSQVGAVRVDRLSDAVGSLDADVLCLQEVDNNQERSGRSNQTAVAGKAMGAIDFRFVAAMTGTPGGNWARARGEEPADAPAYGIALLSRYRVRSWQVTRLPVLTMQVSRRVHGTIARTLKAVPGAQILAGDLNMGPAAAGASTGMRAAVTASTFPVEAPDRQIDHVLVRGLPGPHGPGQ
jgi:endonuclease/exonuclease/phosphatase family metal-dependent hydrolase